MTIQRGVIMAQVDQGMFTIKVEGALNDSQWIYAIEVIKQRIINKGVRETPFTQTAKSIDQRIMTSS